MSLCHRWSHGGARSSSFFFLWGPNLFPVARDREEKKRQPMKKERAITRGLVRGDCSHLLSAPSSSLGQDKASRADSTDRAPPTKKHMRKRMEKGAGKESTRTGTEAGSAVRRLMRGHAAIDRLAQTLDALPATRVFEAFTYEAYAPGTVPTLFHLCVRASVPFAVVDTMLQERYRAPPPLAARHARSKLRCRRNNNGNNDDDDDDDDNDVGNDEAGSVGQPPKPMPWPSPWVSHCACKYACRPTKAAGSADAIDFRRGRLVEVPSRTALRIIAWQWASTVTGCTDATLRWKRAVDVGPYPVPEPWRAVRIPGRREDGYADDRGAAVRISPRGGFLIGTWPRSVGACSGANSPASGYVPFEHYGEPVERVAHPWDARIHVDLYDRSGAPADDEMAQSLPYAVARVDGDPVFLVAVYGTETMTA